MSLRSERLRIVGLVALLALAGIGCSLGSNAAGRDGGGAGNGAGGVGGITGVRCVSDGTCRDKGLVGHRCALQEPERPPPLADAASENDASGTGTAKADDDGGNTSTSAVLQPAKPSSVVLPAMGYCASECEQALCPDGTECLRRLGVCERVDCGRVVPCPGSSSALYCDLANNTCHRESGQCGLVGNENYGCPEPSAWDRSGVSIRCDRPTGESVGMCRFDVARPQAPTMRDAAGNEIPRDLAFAAPAYGSGVPDVDSLEFAFTGSAEVAFVVVMEQAPQWSTDIMEHAVWVAALPRSKPGHRRRVAWSAGHEVIDGVWQQGPGRLTPDRSYYAIAVTVADGRPVAVSGQLLLFEVGAGFPEAGKTLCNVAAGGGARAAAAACYHPTDVLACISDHCERLCLSRNDCDSSQTCFQDPTLGVRYCL